MIRFFNKQKQFEQDVMEQGMQYSSGFYGDSLRRLKKNKMAMFCAGILVLLVLVAIFAPVIAPYDPTYQDYSAVLAEPSMAHPFGTDEYGRDILSRIIYGSRVSLSIGIVAQVVASLVGVTLGAVAGYYGGRIDSVYCPRTFNLGSYCPHDPRFCDAVKGKGVHRGQPRLRSIYLLDHHQGTGSQLPLYHHCFSYPGYPQCDHV